MVSLVRAPRSRVAILCWQALIVNGWPGCISPMAMRWYDGDSSNQQPLNHFAGGKSCEVSIHALCLDFIHFWSLKK
jgi:hypothetical protein